MEVEKKKAIMIAIIVVCLILAVVVTVARYTGGTEDSLEGIPDDVMIWVKCMNPKCNAEYEMSKKAYYLYLQGKDAPEVDGIIQLAGCKECGKESLTKAVKCEKCGEVFMEGAVTGDFPDRCPNPECKYSKIEEIRKQAR